MGQYALVDGNCFYVSCERLFNPALEGRPVIVLSNNDGCVVSRSDEAKAIGIKMASAAHLIADLLRKHRVVVFSSNYNLYGDVSSRMMTVLGSLAPGMEVYSIDEAFLDLRGIQCANWWDYGQILRSEVLRRVGIPTGVGIGPTKTLAKVANHFAKKDRRHGGVFTLETTHEIEAALRELPIGNVWGIGGQYEKLLLRHNVRTALEFTEMPADWVRRNMSVVGQRLQQELRGIPCLEMESVAPPKKNICTSRSFGKMLTQYIGVSEAVANHAHRCACKLRQQHSAACVLTVFLHTNPFKPELPQYNPSRTIRLPTASNSSLMLVAQAEAALKAIWRDGYAWKKAGVMVSGIVPENEIQLTLDHSPKQTEKHKRLMLTLDSLRGRYGHHAVSVATQGVSNAWKLRQERLSPRFTTNWNDLLEASV
ncbi:MAG: Y-family DNA polymerase [Saprospiraceae bacterium]|nr:Y-family DNA polymerase [Saprospiraceae bacterium]